MRSAAQIRREAMLEAISWLEYRAAVCRETEQEWTEKHGEGHRCVATERSSRMELELAIREIARIAGMPLRSKERQREVEKRRAYVLARGPVRAFDLTPTPRDPATETGGADAS